jgi:DNA-binding PadR family transcriptional regulator
LRQHSRHLCAADRAAILRQMEELGYLAFHTEGDGGSQQKIYRLTATGRELLAEGRQKLRCLAADLLKGQLPNQGESR